jgi:hypothetical protein
MYLDAPRQTSGKVPPVRRGSHVVGFCTCLLAFFCCCSGASVDSTDGLGRSLENERALMITPLTITFEVTAKGDLNALAVRKRPPTIFKAAYLEYRTNGKGAFAVQVLDSERKRIDGLIFDGRYLSTDEGTVWESRFWDERSSAASRQDAQRFSEALWAYDLVAEHLFPFAGKGCTGEAIRRYLTVEVEQSEELRHVRLTPRELLPSTDCPQASNEFTIDQDKGGLILAECVRLENGARLWTYTRSDAMRFAESVWIPRICSRHFEFGTSTLDVVTTIVASSVSTARAQDALSVSRKGKRLVRWNADERTMDAVLRVLGNHTLKAVVYAVCFWGLWIFIGIYLFYRWRKRLNRHQIGGTREDADLNL